MRSRLLRACRTPADHDPWTQASFGRRRWILFACGAVLVACSWVAILLWGFAKYDEVVTRTVGARGQSTQMRAAVLDQHFGLRGYAQTHQAAFLTLYRAGEHEYELAEEAADSRGAESPALRRLLEEQSVAAARWQTLAKLDIARVQRTGGLDERAGAALTRERLIEAFRGANSRYQRELDRSDRALRRRAITQNVLIVLGLTGLLTVLSVMGVLRDVRRQRRTDRRIRALIDNSPDLVTVVDAATRVLFQSEAASPILGWTAAQMRGRAMAELLHPDDAERVLAAFARATEHYGVSDRPTVCRWRHADGTYRWVETARNNLLDDPQIRGVVLNSRDVSERRALSDQLTHQAFHDRLTGLPNQTLLHDRLGQALASQGAGAAAPAVVLLDLIEFEHVNESLGRTASNELITRFAARLTASVRATDIAARTDGNGFAVLLGAVQDQAAAVEAAERLLAELLAPFDLRERHIRLHGCVGLAIARVGETAEDVLRNASVAVAAAHQGGKGTIELYRPRLHQLALQRLDLEGELRDALQRDELVVHYQPVFAAATGSLIGTEALVRWQHPVHGLLGPGAFLEVAEESGLIVALGRYVLRAACRQTADWNHSYGLRLNVGVNFSPVELELPAVLVADVACALRESGLDPARLIAEITETVIARDPDAAVGALTGLRALGVRTAIDDFGTGYSSMSRLASLPLDGLKIPKPFVDAITHDRDAYAVAQGIIDLGHRLRLGIVAEGIETAAQLDAVRAMGCDLAQGFHLARPAPARDLAALLDAHAIATTRGATRAAAAMHRGQPVTLAGGRQRPAAGPPSAPRPAS